MTNNTAHFIFYGDSGTTAVLRVELGYTTASGYRLQVGATNDTTTFTNSGWVNLTDAPHTIELDWQASTAAGANNGKLDWWLDGTAQTGLFGIDNDTRRIDRARIGLVAGIDTTTTGSQYFDAFESRRQSYIGSGTSLPEAIFANDFESGNLNYWTSSTGSPTVTTAASLAPAGTQGLSVNLASATTAKYVTDSTPTYESRYRARFYFDPNSITMANNSNHVIFYGDSGTTAVLRLELQFASGNYQLRAGLTNDTTTFTNSSWVNIADAPHVIEIDWKASTAPGANNGSLNWWIDESQQAALSNIDNDTRRIDRVRLGAVAAVDATTNGTLYFDAFESRRSTYIGPMPSPVVTTTITYVYDPLYRLKEANYSDGRYFRYTYDAVGNRLTEEKCAVLPCGTPITNTYTYDSANRLTNVNGQTYQWDANGNLLNDGVSTYTYDAANRLTSVTQGTTLSSYSYNGLGDRLSQTVDSVTTNYVLDLNAGLTQVLADGTNTYLYGNGRIGELQPGGFAYHLGDALGSVRQLTDAGGGVTLARSYEPYGTTLTTDGTGNSVFAFTGEQWDSQTNLLYLRARFYASVTGRFLTADTWRGEVNAPSTLNPWNYGLSNPLRYTDPSGKNPIIPGLCAVLILIDGPVIPIGDAACVALLAAVGITAVFYATTPPPQGFSQPEVLLPQHTGTPGTQIQLPQHTGDSLVGPQLPQHTGDPLLSTDELRCNTPPIPLDSGLHLPPHTPPFGLPSIELSIVYQATIDADDVENLRPTEKAIRIVENHLKSFSNPLELPEKMMLERLKAGRWTEFDRRFFVHEIIEAALVAAGMSDEAHQQALEMQGIPYTPGYEAYLYHPDIINDPKAGPWFNEAARALSKLLTDK